MTTTSDSEEWAPLEIAEDEIEMFTALHEGLTPWLEPSLSQWISDRFTTDKSAMYPGFNSQLARKCERTLRVRIEDDGLTALIENPRLCSAKFLTCEQRSV